MKINPQLTGLIARCFARCYRSGKTPQELQMFNALLWELSTRFEEFDETFDAEKFRLAAKLSPINPAATAMARLTQVVAKKAPSHLTLVPKE